MSRDTPPSILPKGTCGKITYGLKGDAKRVARRTESSNAHESKKGRINVYRCEPCGGWHIGHSKWNSRLGEPAKEAESR